LSVCVVASCCEVWHGRPSNARIYVSAREAKIMTRDKNLTTELRLGHIGS